MRLGRDLDSLLWDIAKRIDAPEFRFFIIALNVQRETGGNLAETLNNLADVLRGRRAMRAKARAMASEARASTIILGSLPILVTVILSITSPTYISPLFTDVRGLMLVGSAIRMLLTGIGDHGQDGAVRNMTSTRVEDFRLEDWLPYWLSTDDLIAGLAALAVLVAVFLAIWQALRPSNPFDRRYAQIMQRREGLRQSALDPQTPAPADDAGGLMSEVVTAPQPAALEARDDARMLLPQAGIRSNDAMVRYLFARLAMPFVFGAIVACRLLRRHMIPVPEKFRTFAAAGRRVARLFRSRRSSSRT